MSQFASTVPTRRDLQVEAVALESELSRLLRSPAREFGSPTPGRDERIAAATRRLHAARYAISLHDELDGHIAAAARHEMAADRADRAAERGGVSPTVYADLRAEARQHRREMHAAVGRIDHVRSLLAKETP